MAARAAGKGNEGPADTDDIDDTLQIRVRMTPFRVGRMTSMTGGERP
jgi:hypothetical protein